ncbi:hypothetical protein DITRI_Ditri02bG0148700 [Diplodiscus trichospermus]
MAKAPILKSKAFKAPIYILFLAIFFTCSNSARVLDEVEAQPQVINDIPQPPNTAVTTLPPNTLPSGQGPAVTQGGPEEDDTDPPLPEAPAAADEEAVATPAAPVSGGALIAGPVATSAQGRP